MTGELRMPAGLEEDGLTLVLHLRAPLDPLQVEQVCAALRLLLDGASQRDVVCHVHGAPDVSVVGALARLALLTRRVGVPVTLLGCDSQLDELLSLTGLEDVVRAHPPRPFRPA